MTRFGTPERHLPTAQALDKRLRTQARAVVQSMEDFRALVQEALRCQLWIVLGFNDAMEYIADVVNTEMGTLSVDDRRTVVAVLSGEGMSTRAIGKALGVSNATVSRDEQVLHDVTPVADPKPVTGLDGKTYPRPNPKPKPPPKPPPVVDVPARREATVKDVLRELGRLRTFVKGLPQTSISEVDRRNWTGALGAAARICREWDSL